MSGSDDGTVRHYDTRDPESSSSLPGMQSGDVVGQFCMLDTRHVHAAHLTSILCHVTCLHGLSA